MSKPKESIPLSKALYGILASIVVVTGGAALFLLLYHKWQGQKREDPSYFITKIVQTGPEKNALPTEYLAELLRLSKDRPAHLFSFDIKSAEALLTSSPLIKQAKVRLVRPDTVYIDYTARKAVATLYEYPNVAIDEEGHLFPISPFYAPKQLPEIYLGLASSLASDEKERFWSSPLQSKEVRLALDLVKKTEHLKVRWVDVSKAFLPSLGSREVVILLEEESCLRFNGKEHLCKFPHYVRLRCKQIDQALSNYLELSVTLLAKAKAQLTLPQDAPYLYTLPEQVIDLRVEGMGFIEQL